MEKLPTYRVAMAVRSEGGSVQHGYVVEELTSAGGYGPVSVMFAEFNQAQSELDRLSKLPAAKTGFSGPNLW